MLQLSDLHGKLETIHYGKEAVLTCFSEAEKFKNSNLRKRILWETRACSGIRKLQSTADHCYAALMWNKSALANDLKEIRAAKISNDAPFQISDNIANSLGTKEKELWSSFYSEIRNVTKGDVVGRADQLSLGSALSELIKETPDDLSTIFTRDECTGKALDLNAAYEALINWRSYRSSLNDTVPSYYQLCKTLFCGSFFESIPYHLKYNGSQYLQLLQLILTAVKTFYYHIHPFADVEYIENDLESRVKSAINDEVLGLKQSTHDSELYIHAIDYLAATHDDLVRISQKKKNSMKIESYEHPTTECTAVSKDREIYHKEFEIKARLAMVSLNTDYTLRRILAISSGSDMSSWNQEVSSDDDDDEFGTKEAANAERKVQRNKNLGRTKIPLGPDGNPIPYWLYKLHGLHIPYSCEICGGEVYYGLKVFESHFSSWNHNYGLSCLGIPYTPEFNNISKINDAIALFDHLKSKKQTSNVFRGTEDCEIEDEDGNILQYQTYLDLQRSGLL